MNKVFCFNPASSTFTTERSSIMAKTPSNHGKQWSPADVSQLKQLVKQNTPTRVIGLKMGRTEDAVRAKASETDVSLKPKNQSPYNRRKP
jgi:ABC-type Zn uptake system ZnuABC Zn-binding protein ZnuA